MTTEQLKSKWWWLSFADDANLGAAVIHATDMISAVERAHLLGFNPGGEVLAVPFQTEDAPSDFELRERFISPEELRNDPTMADVWSGSEQEA